jgi:pyridoxal phosphate enzyme (YggS family)
MQQSGDSIPQERLAKNLQRVRARIDESASKVSRDSNSIVLVGVTKYASNEHSAALSRLGVLDLGESRVQDAERKIHAVANNALRWHLIGHLQTNKAAKAVRLFHTIHSLDSARLALDLDKEARKFAAQTGAANFAVQCLIEINAAREANKFGLPPERSALLELLKQTSALKMLRVAGLMSMAPYADNPEPVSRPVFQHVRELLHEANTAKVYPAPLSELSMGMTQDFQIAIEEGATIVRIGTALFE